MFKSIFLNRWECLPSQWKELRNGRPRYTLLSLKCVFYWFAQQSPIWQPNISVEPGLPQNHPNHQSCFLSFSLQIRLHLITIAHLVINILVLVLLFYFCWSATMPEWVVTCAQELHNPLFFQLFFMQTLSKASHCLCWLIFFHERKLLPLFFINYSVPSFIMKLWRNFS